MSRIYDNWEKLVGAVLRKEKDRQLALCPSFSSLDSSDSSSRPSFAADPSVHAIFVSHAIMAIPFEEIKLATQNFQPDMLLGEGRFGPVYKGWIHEHFLTAVKPGTGIAVAIKKLHEREIYYFNQPRHLNLVKLIGYGLEDGGSALVYEFMPNGSLDNHLFTRGPQLLSWETRMKVAIGAARGLSFLHEMEIIVTHEGIKSSSILLDDEFNPSLSDFDLARAPPGSSNMPPLVRNDYTAPELTTKGCLTMKSDVYSFGIILLELLSGFRVLDHNRPMKDQNLIIWAKSYLKNKIKLLQIVDSRLDGQYPHDEAYKVGKLAFQCLSIDPKRRPMMSEVVDILEQVQCLNTEVNLSHAMSLGPRYFQNPRKPLSNADIDVQMVQAGSSNWSVLGPATLSRNEGEILENRSLKSFEYNDLQKATRNFHPDLVLGGDGFGRVFKGWIGEHTFKAAEAGKGMVIAVKRLNQILQGPREWLAGINYLGRLHHPNLVKLFGYCLNNKHRLLVYEFVPCGSLENHLFRRMPYFQPLSWNLRMKVALCAAKGLAFFHSLQVNFIFRDFKSSNILLDKNCNAKLSDFWLSMDGPLDGKSNVSTRIMGAHGYAAPEYIAMGHLSLKSNVYSFGVVLLEMLTGRHAMVKNQPDDERTLVEWARPYLAGELKVLRVMDAHIVGQYTIKDALQAAKLVVKCIAPEPKHRPMMDEVVKALEQLQDG